jgi:hypothetical protein
VPARRLTFALLTACFVQAIGVSGAAARLEHPIPGVELRRFHLRGPVRGVVLRIDPSAAGLEAVPARPLGGYSTLRSVADRYRVIVAINGDMSREGWPAHLLVHDGRLLTSGDAGGAAVALDRTGTRASLLAGQPSIALTRLDTGLRVAVARWNGGDAPGRRLAVYSSAAAPLAGDPAMCSARLRPSGESGDRFRVAASACGTSIGHGPGHVIASARRGSPSGRWLRALEPGVPIAVRVRAGLPTVAQSFGGMPVLVRHRRIVPQRCGALTCALHPRTAIGFSAGCSDAVEASECRLLVVIVDGRRPRWSIGVTTDRLARLMRRFGASEAVNLDGGASSQVIVDGTTRNRPAPGARRAVVSALIVRVPPAGGRNLL